MKRLIFAILGVLIFCGLSAQEIPQKISYQGKLYEGNQPVNTPKDITFKIGTSWEETHLNVPINDGLYSVTLGETTPIPISIFDNSTSVSLEITVESTNLEPETDILSVAYAYKSEKSVDAEKLNGQNPTFYNNWNNLNNIPSDIADGDDVDDADNNSSNECQTLSVSGNTLYISPCGNSVTLPGGSLWTSSGSDIYYNTGKVFIGTTTSSGSLALEVQNSFNNGAAIGAYDYTNSSAAAVFGMSNSFAAIQGNGSNANYAGYFTGNVSVSGTLSKGGGSFKIDHPLDPENKYLYHSFVESPDMMNVYNGNIVLDSNGEAIVELPEWFDVLNRDFRYQLTCIAGFAPVYIAEKISGNSFKIAGGTSGMEVSWQVTGIRQDPYANQNRIQVEVEKSEKEKGHYLHYKEYNQPIENSIEVVNNPKILNKIKEQNMEGKK
ncbi:MAG: hypothetical protein H8D45_12955 [Bacteroidetes bacterium]|nr:hypothetical protein [Bacteroidota bacterium]